MTWLGDRRTRRHLRNKAAVRRALLKLREAEGYAIDIMALARLSSGHVYVALAQLESDGEITRRPDEAMPPPKRYLYRLKSTKDTA